MAFGETPTASMKFKFLWRPYQARVLEAIDEHLEDGKLHLVAPPGSGKTILGLEVFRRLGNPALVLAPTRVIRDQWLKRLGDFYPQPPSRALPWTSADLKQPAFFTATTYQSLHATVGSEAKGTSPKVVPNAVSIAECAALLIDHGVKTLILDECHHLKSAWWSSLSLLVSKVPGLTLVSLTGTPPLDVKHFQWRKYLDLCGPIDEEIGVPELVKAGTLCPHQDYIWAVELSTRDKGRLREFAATIHEFVDVMDADLDFFEHMLHHPWRMETDRPPISEMLAKPKLAYAVMIYWRAKRMAFPEYVQEWMKEKMQSMPGLDIAWWQILLKGYLFWKDWPHSPASKKHRDRLAKQMRSMGLLHQRELRLQNARPMKRLLTLSAAKMDSCLEIYRVEREIRGSSLRQVFLTDFIRDEIDISDDAALAVGLGAWPLFYNLAVNMPSAEQQRIAMLTGRKSVIHRTLWSAWCDAYPDPGEMNLLAEHPDFVTISASSSSMSRILTRWLKQGDLNVLVGTRALLGEGWDAPCVNSLILASFIGSFVTTNQMRGRAIRVDPEQPDKWASIWHLVAVDDCPDLGMLDFLDVERRFDTFVGLKEGAPQIENNLARMDLPFFSKGQFAQDKMSVPEMNVLMMERLLRGQHLKQRWQEAIGNAVLGRMVPSISTPIERNIRGVYVDLAVRACWENAVWMAVLGIVWLVGNLIGVSPRPLLLWTIFFTLANPSLRKLGHFWRILNRMKEPEDSFIQMGLAVCDALCETDFLKRDRDAYEVVCKPKDQNTVFVFLRGGDFYEQSLFADSFEMLLKPVTNPRYMLEMTLPAWRKAGGRTGYAVPTVLGTNHELASVMHRHWRKRVGKADLTFTRLDLGRGLLLESQIHTLTDAAEAVAGRVDRWL